MSQFDRNSSNHLGARSKIRVSADSNSRKGKKKGQNGNLGEKKLWEGSNASNKNSRNTSMHTWDHTPANACNDAWNKKDSWEESMRKKKEPPTLWNSIEQDFPSLGVSQKKSQRNVWTDRQQKFEEVKSLQPTSEAEEQKMIQIALEMSKLDVRSDEANRKRLEEEYRMQEEILKLDPDYFKEFVPEDLCNVDNNFHSEGYATSEQKGFAQDYNSSNNNNWDTWNDYSNFGVKNSSSSKDTSGCESIWDDCSRETTKSESQNSKQKDYESIWGEVNDTSSSNWNSYSDTKPKENVATKSSSNYNSVDSFDDSPVKTSQKPKMKNATKNSDDWNDYSGVGNLKNSTARNGSSFKSGNHQTDSKYKSHNSWNSKDKSHNSWNDSSDSGSKKTSKNSSSYKNDNHWDNSTDKSHEQSTKNSSKKYDEWDAWDNGVDSNNSDNADARYKRNYSNFEDTSVDEKKPASVGFKVTSDKFNSNSDKIDKSNSKADNKKSSSSGKKSTEDIKKVVDLFGGWGSASDYSRKPNTNAKSENNLLNSTDSSDYGYKNAYHHKVSKEESPENLSAVASQSPPKLTMQNSSIKSESFINSDEGLEEVVQLKLSEDNESAKESQNSYFNSQISPVSEESFEAKNNSLVTDDDLTTPSAKTSDFVKSDVLTSSVSNLNIYEHNTINSESLNESNSLVNESLPTNSGSVYIHSPKPASESLEFAGISKPFESHLTSEFVEPSTLNTHSSYLNNVTMYETSQLNKSNDDKVESPVNNSPLVLPPTDLPSESPTNPLFPIHPMAGGFINPNMMPGMNPSVVPVLDPSMMPGMNPSVVPVLDPSMMPGMNPMMVAGMNPLLMQQMLFLSNPFLASQFRAMEMYYRSMGMATVPQGMFPPQMSSTPGLNGGSFPNATDNSCDNTINAQVPPNNCDIDSNSPLINPTIYTPNNKLSFPLNEDGDSSSHILRYDPDDADSLLQQFLDPCDNDNFIPPPVMPKSRSGNPANKQIPSFTPEAYKPVNSHASSSIDPAEYKDNIGNKNMNDSYFSNSGASWNETVSGKEPIAVKPESNGWGDFEDSDGIKCNWNDEVDGWGNENYTSKAMGNPSKYGSKKQIVNRQPSSQPSFSRYKK